MLAYIPYMDPRGMAAVSFRKLIGGQISSEASLLPGLCGGAGKPTGHQSCNRSRRISIIFRIWHPIINGSNWSKSIQLTHENNMTRKHWIHCDLDMYIYIILYITLYRIYYYIIFNGYDSTISNDPGLAAAGPRPVSSVGGAVAWGCKYCLDDMDIFI